MGLLESYKEALKGLLFDVPDKLPMEGRATFLPFMDKGGQREIALPGLLAGMVNAATAPGRSMTDPNFDQNEEGLNFALNLVGGGGGLNAVTKQAAGHGTLGSAPIRGTKPLGLLDEYGGDHRPPMKDSGAPLHDLTGGGNVYPDDIYSANAQRYYGTGENYDAETFGMINQMKGRPNAEVTIYRAIPDTNFATSKQIKELNTLAGYKSQFGFYPMGDKTIGKLQDKYDVNKFGYDGQQNKIAEDLQSQIDLLVSKKSPKQSINIGDWVTINKQYAKNHGEGALYGKYKILSKKVKAKDIYTNGDSAHEFGYDPN